MKSGARSLVRKVWCAKFGAQSWGAKFGAQSWGAKFGARSLVREVWRVKFGARSFAAKFCAKFPRKFVRRKWLFTKSINIPPKLQRKLPGLLLLRLVRKISLEISPSCASKFSRI